MSQQLAAATLKSSVPRRGWLWVFLLLLVLATAFGTVHVKDAQRRLHIAYQAQEAKHEQLMATWQGLLSQHAELGGQKRIADQASTRLHMHLPRENQVAMLPLSNVRDGEAL